MTMNRITLHHTGGPGRPTAEDKRHYHRIVDAEGRVHQGEHPIGANAPGKRLVEGAYAAHTAGLNTGNIGVSICAMGGAEWGNPPGSTAYFPTAPQLASFVHEAARLCRVYSITPDRKTVLTHAEVQKTLGVKQKNKWDFDYDPFGVLKTRDPLLIGDMLRQKISDEISRQVDDGRPRTSTTPLAILRRGATGDLVEAIQKMLLARGFDPKGIDGRFGPGTEAAVIAFQEAHQLLPDGVAGPMTFAALNP